MSDTIPISAGELRQLAVITRRLEQVEPVISAIHRATEHLPAADRLAVLERLKRASRAQRGTWDVGQPGQRDGVEDAAWANAGHIALAAQPPVADAASAKPAAEPSSGGGQPRSHFLGIDLASLATSGFLSPMQITPRRKLG